MENYQYKERLKFGKSLWMTLKENVFFAVKCHDTSIKTFQGSTRLSIISKLMLTL